MFNPTLAEQLEILKPYVKHPKGYKKWKAKFDYWFKITKDVQQTLDIMYGPGGGVNHYKGSICCNAKIKMPTKQPRKHK